MKLIAALPRIALLVCSLALLLACPSSEPDEDAGDNDDSAPNDDDSADDDDSAAADDDDSTPDPCADPPPECLGICALEEPVCTDTGWECTAPGMEAEEVSCDGFDNDCDGEVDEGGICPDCTPDAARIAEELYAIWDIDFDFDCNAYLTTLVSGPDWTRRVPADPAEDVVTWYGNANQNMGWALVDPDPNNRRIVVTYSCCSGCGCQASNGLTLLYTCTPDDPGCGCAGETNCPGFLDEPFLAAGYEDVSATYNGSNLTTPIGLAAGPRNSYFAGNYRPASCSDEAGCIACDPANPGVFCNLDNPNCCDSAASGRLVRFRVPTTGAGPSWRVDAIFEGEVIQGLATGRNGSVLVGTNQGNLYLWNPVTGTATLLQTYAGAVYTITQSRITGDWYLEARQSPKVQRLSEAGSPLSLPAAVPSDPAEEATLQWGPDNRIYRVIARSSAVSPLEVWDLN